MPARQNNLRPILPREHGAWAMFIVPLCIGIAAARTVNLATLFFALTAFGFFLLRYPMMLAIKNRAPDARREAIRWSAIYGTITLIAGALLMIAAQLWLLIPLGALGAISLAFYLWLAARRAEMSVIGEWTGIVGLALGAPGAYLVATNSLDTNALALYILNVLYFGGTISYIKFKVREQPRVVTPNADWRARVWAGRVTIIYHAFAFALIAAFATLGFLPALVTLAFVPALCKAIGGAMNRPARLNIRHLGFIELGSSILFAILVLLAYR